jgi:hypothetical protein
MDFVDTVPGALQLVFGMAQADGRERWWEAFMESLTSPSPTPARRRALSRHRRTPRSATLEP